jgi:putative transposase
MVPHKRCKGLSLNRPSEPWLIGANQECAMDFILDGLATGRMVRMVRMLSVVDATRMSAWRWRLIPMSQPRRRILERLVGERGSPENVLSDNGSEFPPRRRGVC